ncbi:hypothetical protein ACQY0O_000872 [Thecaphora frezii]|nr:putative duf1741 domain-containing protein [Thecaphora frezii]
MAAPFQTSRPPLRSKFSECYTHLLSGKQPWTATAGPSGPLLSSSSSSLAAAHSDDAASRPSPARGKSTGKSNAGPRNRYFADLLCLPVETQLVVELLDAVPAETLLDDDPLGQGALIRENVGSLWREAIRVWRQDDENEVRRKNAVDTLVALSYPILGKKFSNYAFDLIAIFAGGMEEADDVFISLVDAIDDALRAHQPRRTALASSIRDEVLEQEQHAAATQAMAYLDRDLQHRALQLGLLWLSSVSQTSLGAYFLRRDLFSTITSFVQTPSTSIFAFESSLFMGLLATVGQGSSGNLAMGSSTSNPYARRMRDWVDHDCMHRILVATAAALKQGTERYVELVDDSPPSIAASIAGLASLKWMSGIGEMVGMASSASSSTIASEANGVGNRRPSATGLDFSHLPPPAVVALLPIFLLGRSNQAFTSTLVSTAGVDGRGAVDVDEERNPYVSLLSLSTYLCTHAASTPRSRCYARIALLLLLVLLYDPSGARTAIDDSESSASLVQRMRVCRQREPALAYPRSKRSRLLTCNLDVATCHLRYNLSKRLDVHGYLLSLKLIQRSIALCALERVPLEYDWADTWASIFSLAAFVAGRHDEMRVSTDISQLIKAVVSTINTALLRSDQFLTSTKEIHAFLYELVRSSHALRNLVRILDPSIPASPSQVDPTGAAAASSAPAQAPAPAPIPAKLYALLPGYRNIERVLTAVEARISDWVAAKPASRRNKAPDIASVNQIIASLDLEALLTGGDDDEAQGTPDSARMRSNADLEWLDRMQEGSLAEFVRFSCADIVRILPIY